MQIIKIKLLSALIITFTTAVKAQDIRYVRQQLEILCSPDFHGRGYYKNGDRTAAEHLAAEYKKFNIKSYGSGYFQDYSFNVNSLEEVSFKINGKELNFGDDYMMNATSGSGKGTFEPVVINAGLMRNPGNLFKTIDKAGEMPLVVLDSMGLNNPDLFRFVKTMIMSEQYKISGLIEVYSKNTGVQGWSEPVALAIHTGKQESNT
jgi:hypothetical protein